VAKTPQATLDRNKRWRDRNRAKLRQYDKEYYAAHAEERRADSQARKAADPGKRKAQDHAYYINSRRKVRQQIIEKLGGKCTECGFSDWRALHIDHVQNGGTKHRKKSTNLFAYYKEIFATLDTEAYQLLCANCNQIKRYTETMP